MIAQFVPTSGNQVREDVFLTFNFKDKKVFDYIMIKKKDSEGYRIFFIIFLTDANDLYLIKHNQGESKVYTDSDLIGTPITLSNPMTHIRGYFRKIKDQAEAEDGFVVVERQETDGAQYMRRYVVSHNDAYVPEMSLAGVQSIGQTQIGQLEVNNKFIILSKPTQGKLMLHRTTDLASLGDFTRPGTDMG